MINTGGKTRFTASPASPGAFRSYKGFFFEGPFGGAVNTSTLRDEPGRVNTGCRWDFRRNRAALATSSPSTGILSPISSTFAPCELLHPHQSGPDPGRRKDRLQVLTGGATAPSNPDGVNHGGCVQSQLHPRVRRRKIRYFPCTATRTSSRTLRATGSEQDGRSIRWQCCRSSSTKRSFAASGLSVAI